MANVKITALTDIGANILYTALIPMVNMAGTPTTERGNIQILGNYILAGAGTANFAPAHLSNLTYSVVNAAQPNITSVGTLTSLAVTGTTTTANLNVTGNITANSGSNVVVKTITGNTNHTWLFGADGNLTLPNNTFAVNYANGTQVTLGVGGGLPLANGTSNFNIATANGNPTITANGTYTWGFDNTGNLVLPVNAFAFKYANGSPIVFNTIGNFEVSGNMFMLNDPNVDMVIQQSAIDNTSIRLIPDSQPGSGVHIETNNQNYIWHFNDTGNLTTPGNVIMDGTQLFVGPGADLLPNVANSTLVISSNSTAYIQAIINNISDIGSADWIAQGHYGDDDGGYIDFGFNSSAYNDPTYDMTSAGDGYVYVQGYYPGQAPNPGGGNLVLTTGDQGLYRDIIFGTGGLTSSNIFAKISDANNAFEIIRPNADLKWSDGSFEMISNYSGTSTSLIKSNVGLSIISEGNISRYLTTGYMENIADPSLSKAIINYNVDLETVSVLAGNTSNGSLYSWSFDNTGNLTTPGNIVTNGEIITGTGSGGNISGANVITANIFTGALANGTSNINIPAMDGNINLSSSGNANILVITGTGANINGTLTMLGNIVGSGASPAPTLSGFSSVNTIYSVTTPVPYSTLTAVAGARAFITDANLVAAGNFGALVGNGGSNIVPVWSDGTDWRIG